MKDRFHLTFSRQRALEPVMCQVAKQFDITFSIRRASVDPEGGWMDLQMEGAAEEVEKALDYIRSCDVRVDPVEGDIVAG